MVRVTGTKGGQVEIQMLGINEVMMRLRRDEQKINTGADLGVVRAGAFIEEEVKQSIGGFRAEPRSVDTGRLANSIEFKKTGDKQGTVRPKKEKYPGTKTTTEDTALFMEYGTTRIRRRGHFGNTKARNAGKIKEIIDKEIKKLYL